MMMSNYIFFISYQLQRLKNMGDMQGDIISYANPHSWNHDDIISIQ